MVKAWQVSQIRPLQLGRDYADLVPLKKWAWRSNSWGLTGKNALSEVCGSNIYHDTDPTYSSRTIQSFSEKFSGLKLCKPISSEDKSGLMHIPLQNVFIETMKQDKILLKLWLGNEDGSDTGNWRRTEDLCLEVYQCPVWKYWCKVPHIPALLSAFGIFDTF